FLTVAAAAAIVTVGLVLQPTTRAAPVAPLAGSLRALVREPHGASVLALMFFVGSLGGIVNLLVPLRLHRDGLGAGAIGIAFTASMALFVLTSGKSRGSATGSHCSPPPGSPQSPWDFCC